MKYFIILLSILFVGCNRNLDHDKIVLTSGLSMNPDSPRFGISIEQNAIYYCEEIITNKESYTYYKSEISSDVFLHLRDKIEKEFTAKIRFRPVIDGTLFQLNTSFDGNQKAIKFYLSNLNESQVKVILEIIEFKELKFEKINYYDFPKELLTERLPEPPSPKMK